MSYPATDCAPPFAEPIEQKLATTIRAKANKARQLVGKTESEPKSQRKLLARAARQLMNLRQRVAKSAAGGTITAGCRATLDALLLEREALLNGLRSP